jgi:hypothetical protein
MSATLAASCERTTTWSAAWVVPERRIVCCRSARRTMTVSRDASSSTAGSAVADDAGAWTARVR